MNNKSDLSAQRVHDQIRLIENEDPETAAMLRALLDAKEAAERENEIFRTTRSEAAIILQAQLTEARASAAADWDMPDDFIGAWHKVTEWCAENDEVVQAQSAWGEVKAVMTSPSATEALRRVKERVWAEGYKRGLMNFGPAGTNPYAAKEAANG